MTIDWGVVAAIAGPIIALFVGAFLNRAIEGRAGIVTYFGHVSAFTMRGTSNVAESQVYTHSVVVRNTGRKAANNIRLGHKYLPNNFNVNPSIYYEITDLPEGGKEIVIPKLVGGEEITISYLYFPPVTWSDINSYVKSDEGPAKFLTVLLTRQYSIRVQRLVGALIIVGAIATLYLAYLAVQYAITLWFSQ